MGSHKYTLERYKGSKTKHRCPKCQKQTFTRYVDSETSEYLSELVGRCDREDSCNYHNSPKQFFLDSGEVSKKVVFHTSSRSSASSKVYVPHEILRKSRAGYFKNTFIQHLVGLFDERTVNNLIATYHLGTSDGRWPGSCIFWFIDSHYRIHAGQVKLFKNGHTASYEAFGESKKCTTWVHSILKTKLSHTPLWLSEYLEQEKKVDCLFGEHLIKTSTKPFAIAEAPATAIVASVYLPQYTWLAAGSLSYLNPRRCEVLRGHKVVFYPDLGAYDKWKAVADRLGFQCTNILEDSAPHEHKSSGYDLRDYLEQYSLADFIKPS